VNVVCDVYDSLDFKLCLNSLLSTLSGPKTSSSSARGIETVASSVKVEFRALAVGPENNGAGGSGLRGLPPYCEEGVPGRGLPLRSAGSNWTFAGGGGRPSSLELLEGVHECVEAVRPLAENLLWEFSGSGIEGAPSTIEGARE
jgi:hypothetical protein